jgi:hypothetical protein
VSRIPRLGAVICRGTEESRELKSVDVDQNSGIRQSKELDSGLVCDFKCAVMQ